jgi:signal transduction histidine kinase
MSQYDTITLAPFTRVFADRRLWLFVVLLVIASMSTLMLLSIRESAEHYQTMLLLNEEQHALDEFHREYTQLSENISRFMLLGSDHAWLKVKNKSREFQHAANNVRQLIDNEADIGIADNMLHSIDRFNEKLMGLKAVRQSGAIISNDAGSGVMQVSNYAFLHSLSLAIETLQVTADEMSELRQLNELRKLNSYWATAVMEFRAHLLLRNEASLRRLHDFVAQFSESWAQLMAKKDDYDFDILPFLEEADEHQRAWMALLPGVIARDTNSDWRNDLRYVRTVLDPVSKNFLNAYYTLDERFNNRQQRVANAIVDNQLAIAVWSGVVIVIVLLLSIALVFIFKRLLKAQAQRRVAAEQASEMKTVFLSRMSHELRTPLNAVLGFAQLLEHDEKERLDEEQQDMLKEIINAGRHLLDLINEILDLTRIEAGRLEMHIEDLSLAEITGECLALTQPLMGKKQIQVENYISKEHDCHVRADRLRLKQVFLNLITNAIKYNCEHGSISLACNRGKNDTVIINISDTGLGVPEEALSQLFEPFKRLHIKNSTEGTGIGLTVAKGLVEAMQGDIGVSSQLGRGSTFWITLPAAG